jgi:hypothetical protein
MVAVSAIVGGFANRKKEGFVGVKNRLANASWVKTRSAGVGVDVTGG